MPSTARDEDDGDRDAARRRTRGCLVGSSLLLVLAGPVAAVVVVLVVVVVAWVRTVAPPPSTTTSPTVVLEGALADATGVTARFGHEAATPLMQLEEGSPRWGGFYLACPDATTGAPLVLDIERPVGVVTVTIPWQQYPCCECDSQVGTGHLITTDGAITTVEVHP